MRTQINGNSKRLRVWTATAIAAALAGACATPRPPAQPARVSVEPSEIEVQPRWRSVMKAVDQPRILALADRWDSALDQARRAGFTRQLRGEGPLLDPDAAEPRAAPAPGSYRCRSIRVGGAVRRRAFAAQPAAFCYVGVEGDLLSLTRQTGNPRPGGYLYEDEGDTRLIFIGAAAEGRERVPPAYGDNPARDVVGVFQRVAAFRYRLVIPRGDWLEVIELVPALG